MALSEAEAIVPADPKEVPCEWCGEPSDLALERKRKYKGNWLPTGTHVYTCYRCKYQAEKIQFDEPRKRQNL